MAGNLTFDDLKKSVTSGEIDTVLVCMVDMQGRLMGKRFLAQYFVDGAHDETHCCNYLLATAVFRQTEKILPKWITKTAPASKPPLTETQCAARLAHTVWDRYQITDKVLNSFINEPPFTNQLYHDRLVDKLEKKLDELRITDNPEAQQRIRNRLEELHMDAQTCVTKWDGEPADYHFIIGLLWNRDFPEY